MESTENNALSTSDLARVSQIISDKGGPASFFNWLESIQSDLIKIPSMLRQVDLVGGVDFPVTPSGGIGLLFLTSGTYEVAGTNSWRRLYDGALFASGVAAP